MHVFVVLLLGYFFRTKQRDWLGERLQNDPFCVEWGIKPQLSINQCTCHWRVLEHRNQVIGLVLGLRGSGAWHCDPGTC